MEVVDPFIVEDAKGNVIYSTHRPKKKIQISFNNELTPMIFDEDLNHSFVHKKLILILQICLI